MASACDSHFVLPSFSLMEPSSRKTCAITILDTDDSVEPARFKFVEPNEFRSKVDAVGDVTLCPDREGENATGLESPPPLLLPPPPPWGAVVEVAAEDAGLELVNGVVARNRGDSS